MKSRIGAAAARLPLERLPRRVKARIIHGSGLVDAQWYARATGRQVADARAAAEAFAEHANDPGNAINPLFDAAWYAATYGLHGSPADLLVHYVLFGERGGLKPHPWFDPGYFLKYNSHRRRFKPALAAYALHWAEHSRAHPHFDGNWYRWQYPDVRKLPGNPLAHFVTHGMAEGREPNAFFSSRWYLSTFADIRESGQNPVKHFTEFGAAEMRSPGPNFDMRRYADQYPDHADTGLDPLAHYLAIGRAEGRNVGTRYVHLWDLDDSKAPAPAPRPGRGVVDVIVPVYRGLDETRACIEALLASRNRCRVRIRLCNDASPEPEVTAYLRDAAARADVILTENPANLGFVGTVNSGMRAALAMPDCTAVVLLNSDTEVANDWVDRMLEHAAKPATGSVTATSNNATICSYPQIGINRLPEDFSVAELDAIAARVNAGESVEIPTAVGFCMLITRACLHAVGLFDEAAFGRGYGEENDFCMRATAAGFRHRHALDVFVKHVGEVSFAQDSNPGKENAGRIISERYPHYNSLVAKFCATDPARISRLRLTMALWREGRRPVTALITHDLGGGTERQVLAIAQELGADGHVVIIRPSIGHKSLLRIENRDPYDHFDQVVDAIDGAGFARLLARMGVTAVQVHHLYDHGDLIRDGLAISGLPFTFDVHDYFVICPQITLTTVDQEYCGEPGPSGCDACIAQRPNLGAADIRNWREAQEWAVLGASEVRAPSHDTASRIGRYFPVEPVVQYHQEPPAIARPAVRSEPVSAEAPLRVVMLGVLSLTKGRVKVFKTIEASHRMGLPISFHLIGDSQDNSPDVDDGRFTTTGWYVEPDLPRLIEQARPDLFLFASAAPETYSFTLTEAMGTGQPILATNLGAFGERLAGYSPSRLYPHDISGAELAERLWAFAAEVLPQSLPAAGLHT
ncbi:glycosyltransferase [Cognatilysobacter lacus]|uniref:glycosyltransferase n=1 Tax=Cognatilysobacter lacus TaxID=1643323 RepID=UPI0016597E05|nr:glycosyltransferase [Lysobacter lacus]